MSVPRSEDVRLLTGHGSFASDLCRDGMVEAAFVRSPFAHARVLGIDTSVALGMPGMVAVITAEELDERIGGMRFEFGIEGYGSPTFGVLAGDRARHVGDPVALVLSDTRASAEDACEAVRVEYEPLEPVLTLEDARNPDCPALFGELGTNVMFERTTTFGSPEQAFADADLVVELSIDTARVNHVPIEGRAGLAEYDPRSGLLTYSVGTRNPHAMRTGLAERLGHPFERLHVIVPDVGGAFGQKAFAAREDVAVCWAARTLNRPVRWIEDRRESLVASTQGRGERLTVRAAVRRDGSILALDVRTVLDQGAYPTRMPIPLLGRAMRVVLPGPYRIDHIRWDETVIATNKASYGPMRGPWACEALIREAVLDEVARRLGLDAVTVRRLNLVSVAEQPRPMAGGTTLEGVRAYECLDAALARLDVARRGVEASVSGNDRLLGVGLAVHIEPAPGPPDFPAALGVNYPPELAIARLDRDGAVRVISSQSPHGQGHETTLAQVAATEFGLPLDRVRVSCGDTRTSPVGTFGTGGSRAASRASGAVLHATRVLRERVRTMAAAMLGCRADRVQLRDGVLWCEDDPGRQVTLASLARQSYVEQPAGERPGLESHAGYSAGQGGWSTGAHACMVEIERETGNTRVLRYVVAEDCGIQINPAIVEGQIRGGVAFGLGVALMEDAGYDEDGNPASTLTDYLIPSAIDVPEIEVVHLASQPLHELDFRGVGEGGAIAAVPAIVNAVANALGGFAHVSLPLEPERLVDLIEAAGR